MEGMGKAKAHMLKELSKEMSNDSNQGLKDILGKKKGMKKVTVASDSEEGLQKGLSMAEKLMQLKEGKEAPEGSMEEEMSSEEESEEESVPQEMDEHVSSMSEEEAMAMFEALKKRLAE